MIQTYCDKGCCSIKTINYDQHYRKHRKNCKKAGVFIYDPNKNSVLLVQSRGQFWGPPKGTIQEETNETPLECALREVKEETGLSVSSENFTNELQIKNYAFYYYLEMNSVELDIQQHDDIELNDANGISWINIDCLENCILNGKIKLNRHAKITLRYFLNKDFDTNK